MFEDITPIVSREEIETVVKRIALSINEDYKTNPPILIGVLKGARRFLSDLKKQITIPFIEEDFIQASSYGTRDEPSPIPVIKKDIVISIEDRDIILVEDIVDRGVTLSLLTEHLKAKKPASLKVCSLLLRGLTTKTSGAGDINRTVDYLGKTIGQGFVVGYGMDYKERYRELDCIYNLSDITAKSSK